MLPCLSFCVLFPMLPMSIFLCLVSNVTHVYLSVSCAECYTCLSFCVLYPMLPLSIVMSPRAQCYPCLSFCVLCPNVTSVYFCLVTNVTGGFSLCLMPSGTRVYRYVSMCLMLHVSIFLCLVPNVTRVYLSLSCVQCYPCLSFCVLCRMLPVSIFLCLATRHRKIETGNIGHKTQKDRHG
jgi:hypothetical protein